VLVAPLTTNVRLADAPGNVAVSRRRSGLPHDSVVNVSQAGPVDRSRLLERHGELPGDLMARVEAGLRLVLAL
jgi:mRNA interferase MazF